MLSSLTSLSIVGSRVTHVTGAAALPRLSQLVIQHTASLCLAGAQHCTALRSLHVSNTYVCHSGPGMLAILQSMSALESLQLDEVVFDGTVSHLDGFLELATMMNLRGLKDLQLSHCDGLGYEEQPGLNGMVCLTKLAFSWLLSDVHEGLLLPDLSQLALLQELCLTSPTSCVPLTIPSELSAMQCLKALDIVATDFGDGCTQFIDISALALLGHSIEKVWITGVVCVRTSCSLLPLAAQPNLQEFHLGSPRKCFMNPEDESWLFCAAFFHALLDRPRRKLPAVSMRPQLGSF